MGLTVLLAYGNRAMSLSTVLRASLTVGSMTVVVERTALGRARLVREKKLVGGPLPFGYDAVEGKLVPSEQMVPVLDVSEADLVRSLFQNVLEASSAAGEARMLEQLGVPWLTRWSGGKVKVTSKGWTSRRVDDILRNTVYMGQYRYKGRQGEAGWSVPALVDSDTFRRVGLQLTKNLTKPKSKVRVNLLLGLLRCMRCGHGFVASAASSGVHYYKCYGCVKPTNCRAGYLKADRVERIAWEMAREVVADFPEHEELEAGVLEREVPEDGEALRQELREAIVQRDRILTLYRRGRIGLEDAEKQLEEQAKDESKR